MCYSEAEISTLSPENLVNNFKRAVELDTKSSGNGKSPFNQNQLKQELLRRLERLEKPHHYPDQEAGDGHDEFS